MVTITRRVALAAMLMLPMQAAQAQDAYEGQTVNIIINLGAGGSTGLLAQLFSQYWSKYIPGNPTFIVTPVEGGGQLKGIMQAQRAKPDGLTIGWVSWSAATRAIGPVEQQVDWKQFDTIAGMGAPAMAYMRNDLKPGIEKPEDIVKAEGVAIGGYRPGSYLDLLVRMSLDILGVKHNYVTGFGGGAPILAAIERGEANMTATPAANYFGSIDRNFVDPGRGLPLWYYPFTGENGELQADPATFGDIRPFHEVVESATGSAPSGPVWEAMKWLNDGSAGVTILIATPKGVEPEKLDILRKSFVEASKDPAYLEQVRKIAGLEPPIITPQGMQRVIDGLSNTDPQIIETLTEYMESGGR